MPMKIGEEPLFDRIDKGIHDGFTRQAIASAQERLRGRKTWPPRAEKLSLNCSK